MKNQKNNSDIIFAVLAVDAVCFRFKNNTLEILLGKINSANNVFNGKWANIGGLIRVNETADEAVSRLLSQKAGIDKIYKEQLYTFSEVDRDPRGRVVSVAYVALANDEIKQNIDTAQLETKWFPVRNLPKLAYDHDLIVSMAINRLSSKIQYTDISRYLMGNEFTLSDLQKVYEAISGEVMDKRNFRKKILNQDIIYSTKNTIKKGVMRPALLYSFK